MGTLERGRALLSKSRAWLMLPFRKPKLVTAVAPKQTPERDIRRLIASDFTGPYRGEVGGSRSGPPRSADELLDRYHRLRNS